MEVLSVILVVGNVKLNMAHDDGNKTEHKQWRRSPCEEAIMRQVSVI
jgi:hypothetical protein